MITAIHQIEITSRCNLACRYCVHPKMKRDKMDMDRETYIASLEWATYFVKKGTQNELNIAGIGESPMHPDFEEYVEMAREAVGKRCQLSIATNGILVTEQLAKHFAKYNVDVWVSLHRPEKAGPAIQLLKKAGVLRGISADPSIAPINWAGQVDWPVSTSALDSPCGWLEEERVFVLSDGRITKCCFDGEAQGVMGTVFDDVVKMKMEPFGLCGDCHHSVPEKYASTMPENTPVSEHALAGRI